MMLSRTASNLFWLGRHMERAENAARLLDVGSRITLLPSSPEGVENEWRSLLAASGTADQFDRDYDAVTDDNVVQFLYFDRRNPSSVFGCAEKARESGRIVRTALTSQVWDALNTAYQGLRRITPGGRDVADLCEFALLNGATVRGAIDASQLRNDGWHFIKLGYALERADATARMLDVKYFVLLPRVEFVGSGLDSYQWQVILRAQSAHRAFHWAYGGDITAARVAHFLMLNGESPRSLVSAVYEAAWHLDMLAARYDPALPATARLRARALLEEMQSRTIEDIFDEGLHEYLSWFIREIGEIATRVQDDYFRGRG